MQIAFHYPLTPDQITSMLERRAARREETIAQVERVAEHMKDPVWAERAANLRRGRLAVWERKEIQRILHLLTVPPEERLRGELAYWLPISQQEWDSGDQSDYAMWPFLTLISECLDAGKVNEAFVHFHSLGAKSPVPDCLHIHSDYWSDVSLTASPPV